MRYLFFILMLVVSIYAVKCDKNTYIPKNAYKYLPLLNKEINKLFGKDFPYPYYFPALIEHESCVVLCGKGYYARRCWNPKSRLKTKREEGAGFFQITRVWTKTGRIRFDTLYNLKRRYPKELKSLYWSNIYEKPELQMRAGLLLWRNNFRYYKHIPINERLWFADSAFNGGYRYLNIERKICKLKPGCNPDKWFGNVELIKSKRAKRKLYGNRTAWDINRYHVKDVKTRMPKYKMFYLFNYGINF